MHNTAMLVFLHGPEEQRLSAALFFPSFPNVLLLLLVLDKMLTIILGEQNAPTVQLGEEIGAERARGSRQPEHSTEMSGLQGGAPAPSSGYAGFESMIYDARAILRHA